MPSPMFKLSRYSEDEMTITRSTRQLENGFRLHLFSAFLPTIHRHMSHLQGEKSCIKCSDEIEGMNRDQGNISHVPGYFRI